MGQTLFSDARASVHVECIIAFHLKKGNVGQRPPAQSRLQE